jgi:drug/metabolite transporter (DMT)-like permease
MYLLLLAALLWGVTNPFLKRFSAGLAQQSSWFNDLMFLLRRPKYLFIQLLNLSGSVAFFAGLRDSDVSTGSIVCNSLAFVITVVMSLVIHEGFRLKPLTYIGMALVMFGTALCTAAK